MRDDIVLDGAGFNHTGPANDLGYPETALPGGALLSVKRCYALLSEFFIQIAPNPELPHQSSYSQGPYMKLHSKLQICH
jgi:hypothetical protein